MPRTRSTKGSDAVVRPPNAYLRPLPREGARAPPRFKWRQWCLDANNKLGWSDFDAMTAMVEERALDAIDFVSGQGKAIKWSKSGVKYTIRYSPLSEFPCFELTIKENGRLLCRRQVKVSRT